MPKLKWRTVEQINFSLKVVFEDETYTLWAFLGSEKQSRDYQITSPFYKLIFTLNLGMCHTIHIARKRQQ